MQTIFFSILNLVSSNSAEYSDSETSHRNLQDCFNRILVKFGNESDQFQLNRAAITNISIPPANEELDLHQFNSCSLLYFLSKVSSYIFKQIDLNIYMCSGNQILNDLRVCVLSMNERKPDRTEKEHLSCIRRMSLIMKAVELTLKLLLAINFYVAVFRRDLFKKVLILSCFFYYVSFAIYKNYCLSKIMIVARANKFSPNKPII